VYTPTSNYVKIRRIVSLVKRAYRIDFVIMLSIYALFSKHPQTLTMYQVI